MSLEAFIAEFQVGLGILGSGIAISVAILTKVYFAGKHEGKRDMEMSNVKTELASLKTTVSKAIESSDEEHRYIKHKINKMDDSYEKRLDEIKSILDVMRGKLEMLVK